MPLHASLKKSSSYGAGWAGLKVLDNSLTLAATILALVPNNNNIIYAQAVLAYASIVFDGVLSYFKTKELIKERDKKFRDDAAKESSDGNENILPVVGFIFGLIIESVGLSQSSSSLARVVLTAVAAPLSTVFYSAHSDAIDHEISGLGDVDEKSLGTPVRLGAR